MTRRPEGARDRIEEESFRPFRAKTNLGNVILGWRDRAVVYTWPTFFYAFVVVRRLTRFPQRFVVKLLHKY